MRIAEFAKQLGVSPDTIRRLERRGVLLSPRRDWVGHRRFTKADLDRARIALFGDAPEQPEEAAAKSR